MIGMRMTVKKEQSLQDGGAPEYAYHDRTAWRCAVFVGKKLWQQRISTKKCCPCIVNVACHVKQSSKTTSFVGTLSWQWRGGMSSVLVVQTATTRILRHRFPGASETVGQVFKFVWSFHWKINAVCMSLSPLVSFKSWFVSYLLNFPRIIWMWMWWMVACIWSDHTITPYKRDTWPTDQDIHYRKPTKNTHTWPPQHSLQQT